MNAEATTKLLYAKDDSVPHQRASQGKTPSKRDLEKFLQQKVIHSNKFYRKREKIVTEIFSSERRYQEQLKVVVDLFMTPLRARGILPDQVFRTIFGDLTAIQSVNKELLAHMEETSIGTAFLQLAPYMRLYCTYANDFDRAMLTLQEWERKTSEFSKFLQEQEGKEACRSLALPAFLITPVQRVPRYKLLLEQLVDHTPPSFEDYKNIKEAAQMMGEVALGINEYIRENENLEKMLSIQQRLTGVDTPRILVPGRKFIREGPLMKVSRKGFGSRERMFFLFSDMLIYAKPNVTIERPLSPKTYLCRQVIPLGLCDVQLVLGQKRAVETGALFKLQYGDEHLLLYSTNHQEALAWIDALKGAIDTHIGNTSSLQRTSAVATETISQTLSPKTPSTPFPYSLRSRPRSKVFDDIMNTPRSQPDCLYPMRSKSVPASSKGMSLPADTVAAYPTISYSPTKDRKTLKSRKRSRMERSFSPFARKKGRKSKRYKKKRLEHGPLPLKRENVENTPSVYHDAQSDLPDGDTTHDFTFHTILEEKEALPTLKRDNPRRRSYRNYEEGEEVLKNLGSSYAEQNSLCVIL
ncbi:putative rho guanine nucleotide exchange factor 39 [Apostichopus japonicus]|uniref:Putative rho guanine nucleotide exchange factor 39 n=1 Tax=Stichopus japonicus TaxID=307972 RepID=A0A2G8L4C8_STIJA|nr:putative rho guanine nucleotide exchange factor 39 [Apostichopus japonicus]